MRWAGFVRRKLMNACACALCCDDDVTAIGFSIRIVAFGIRNCTGWLCCCAKIASFSYARKTSPRPARNVCRPSRALDGAATTCFHICARYACACFGVLPARSAPPYAAMMFQRAPPDVNGFGVTICTPGFTRSAHVLIFFGLPSRTTKTTTERVTMPLYLSLFQFGATRCFCTSEVMSGASDNATMSAGSPDATARLWSPEAPYDCENETSLPAAVFWNAEISWP